MSCAACSTKTLRSFLRSFNHLEIYDPANLSLPHKVRQATRRSFNTSFSNCYRSSLRASSQLQLSELSTKLDDAYLPFVKLVPGAEDDEHVPSWLSPSIANPKPPFQQVSAKSLLVADQSVESRIDASQSPSLNAGTGIGNKITPISKSSESARSSKFTYAKEKGVRSGTKFLRGGRAAIAQQRPYKEANQRDVATASARRSRRPLGVVGAGQTSLKPTPADPARENTEKLRRGGGRRRTTSIAASVQAELGKKPGNREREIWQTQKSALAVKFGPQGWAPRKRLSPDALDGIRALHAQYPETYTTPVLADQFKVSPEAVRRILKSKWRPSEEEEEDRRQRWDKRGEIIWSQMVEIGIKPPKKWREMGVGTHKGDLTKTRRQKGTEATTHRDEVERSKFGKTDSGGAEYDSFTKGSLADRIL